MIIWGIVANSHDASLAVAKTATKGLTANKRTNVLWASLAKDFTGVDHDPHLSQAQVEYAWEHYGAPDRVIWYERPLLKTLRQLRAGQGWLYKENNIPAYLAKYNIRPPQGIKYVQHHLSHAAYAYYTQPHNDCAVICLDSIGEFETLTVWHGCNGKLKKLHSQRYPHSLGLFYSAMTQRLGLTPQRDEYMIADLAKGGDSLRLWSSVTNDIVDIRQDARNPHIRMKTNLHRGCLWWRPDLNTEQDRRDLAATTQEIFCQSVKTLSNWAQWRTGAKHLALAGGSAMNRDAVNRISKDWNSVWVPPRPGDPGSAVGCILAHKQQRINNIDNIWH